MLLIKSILLSILILSASYLHAQPAVRSCTDAEQHNALISINNAAQKQGQRLEFTSDLKMPNKALVPAAVTLEGSKCTVNFIADARAKHCKITVLDDKKEIVLKEKFSGGTNTFNFRARKGIKYIFVFSQKIKGKGDGCAAVSILSQ